MSAPKFKTVGSGDVTYLTYTKFRMYRRIVYRLIVIDLGFPALLCGLAFYTGVGEFFDGPDISCWVFIEPVSHQVPFRVS